MQLLVSLARAVARNSLNLIPWADVLVEIALDTWDDYCRSTQAAGGTARGGAAPATVAATPGETGLRLEVEALARETPAAMRQKAAQVAQEVAGDQPPEAQQALASYLAQVPAMIRRSLRRPSDPTGTSLPRTLSLRRGEDLVALLPPRPPRFQTGDRPLPGVDWVLEELLGVGGFGEVWKARHAQLQGLPPVALKFCLDEQAAKALRNEAGVLDQVMRHGQHEGIVRLQMAYLQAATPCLQYEYISGGDLAGWIQDYHGKGRPSADVAARLVHRLATIIGSVHQQSPPIVHRDLKPANVLVQKTAPGRLGIKVADFGIGQVTAHEAILTRTRAGESRAGLLTSRVQGSYTPLYASPQQMQGEKPDPRDDVYSLGVIWYQVLTGDLGSGAPSGMQWTRELKQRGVPPGHIDLLGSCIESNPAHRPATAARLAEQLSQVLAPSAPAPVADPVPPPPPPPPLPGGPPRGPSPGKGAGTKGKPEVEIVYPISVEKSLGQSAEAEEILDALAAEEGSGQPTRPEKLLGPLPVGEGAGRPPARAEAAAWWLLVAGVGNLVMATYLLATLSAHATQRRGPPVWLALALPALPLVSAGFHFLGCRALRSFKGKGLVVTAIVLGFLLGLPYSLAAVAGLVALAAERYAFVLLLIPLVSGFAAFGSLFAAIRGILALSDPAVGQGFDRPQESRPQPAPVFTRSFVVSLIAALVGFFLVVLLLTLLSLR